MNWLESHLLSIIIFLPIFGLAVISLIPERQKDVIRILSLSFSFIILILTIKMWLLFKGSGDFEFAEIYPWIPSLNIYYRIGIDGVSLMLIILTALLTPIAILTSWNEINKRIKAFYMLMLALETGLLGVFSSLDLFMFYVFWEVVLIPMYFIIGIWGSGNRIKSAIKFFIYTMLGSVLLLVAIIYGSTVTGGSFDIVKWYAHNFSYTDQIFIFITLAIAFGIKVPIFPLHTWLADAHSDAPTAGSVMLAGVLLKMGTYGFYRLIIPILPLATAKFAPIMLTLAVISIIYGGLVAMVQPDFKRLIAYTSISHLGFVMLGLFSLQIEAVEGAVLQMLNHGLSTSALFIMLGMIYERYKTREISEYGGLAKALPVLTTAFIIVSLSSMGLPLLNNFVGEFLILLGSFQTQTIYASCAISGIVISAIYMLWLIQRMFLGKLKSEEFLKFPDLEIREYFVLLPIIILIFAIGICPRPWLSSIQRSADLFMAFSKRVETITTPDAHKINVSDQLPTTND